MVWQVSLFGFLNIHVVVNSPVSFADTPLEEGGIKASLFEGGAPKGRKESYRRTLRIQV